jgi:sugar phosphate isomerase/epimerase
MFPAIWTAIHIDKPICEALRALHACGWDWFELSTEHLHQIEADGAQQARTEEVLRTLDDLEIRMPQAHAHLRADVAHPDESRRAADTDRVHREMACCAALGVKTVVVHPGGGDGYTTADEQRELHRLNRECFAMLADHAAELGLRIALENMMDRKSTGRRGFGARPEELIDLLADLDHPALGICFDTSHANVQALKCADAIRQFGPLICATHISDNDGSGDQHLTPGGGTIDWPSAVAALRAIGYTGIFNLEIPGESEPAPGPALLETRVREALEVARRLLSS